MTCSSQIKLATNDGQAVHIADYYLQAHSSVIRDMLSLPKTTLNPPSEIALKIDLDLASGQILVEYLKNPNIEVCLSSFTQAVGLLNACDFLALETLRKSVLLSLEAVPIPESDIWATFCLAGRYNAPTVAKHALAAIERTGRTHHLYAHPTSGITKEMAEACDTQYLLGYFHAVCEGIQDAYNRGRRDVPWRSVAKNFKPMGITPSLAAWLASALWRRVERSC